MANFDVLDPMTAVVELPIPEPVIIYPRMKFEDWKDYFIQKRNKTTVTAEKLNYNECFKTLLYAELCNAELIKVGNSTLSSNLAVKFTLKISDYDCLKVFQANMNIVTVVSKLF